MPPALVLVAHGSRDPRWQRPLERVVARVQALDPRRSTVLAYLEADPRIEAAIEALVRAGHRDVVITTAFLSAGGRHGQQDIPARVEALRERFPDVHLRLVPGALGDDDEVIEALALAALRRANEG